VMQVELKIQLRQVHATESTMIVITELPRTRGGRAEHLNRLAIFATQIVKVGDVVVGLGYKQGHVVRGAKPSRVLIRRERLRELVQADVADGKIAEDYSQPFGILEGLELTICPLIVLERLGKSVLTVEDVAYIDVEAGQTPGVLLRAEDVSRPIGGCKCAIIFAEQQQGQERSA